MKKVVSIMLVLMLVLSVAGCGKSGNETADSNGEAKSTEKSSESTSSGDDKSDEKASDSDGELIKIRMPIMASSVGKMEATILDEFAKENGYELERIVLPDPEPGRPDKMLVSLMAGDEFDVIYSALTNLKPYYDAGVIEDVEALASAKGDDLDGIFGDYLMTFNDDVVGLPCQVDRAITIYNKTLFEEKGIDLPTMEGWTWDKYIETAEQIRDDESDTWGSFMPAWVHYIYMYAMQKEVDIYTADGHSNLDDPTFAEAMEFYYGLGNDLDIQPSYLMQTSKNLGADMFMQGNVGMTVIGNWALSGWVADLEKFPRDWEVGIAPMPYPEGYQPSTSTVIGGFWVPTTCQDKDTAYDFAKLLAENYYHLLGRIPARVDLTDAEKTDYIINDFSKKYAANDDITTEEILYCLFNDDTRPFNEKPIGAAGAELKTLFANESQLYALGEETSEEVMKRIHESAEEAIVTELSNK